MYTVKIYYKSLPATEAQNLDFVDRADADKVFIMLTQQVGQSRTLVIDYSDEWKVAGTVINCADIRCVTYA